MVLRINSPLRVLQIAPRLPWPLDTGAKLRNFHLGRILSDSTIVTLLAFDSENQSEHPLDKIYRPVVSVRREGHNSFSNLLGGAFGTTPLPLRNYTTAEMIREVQALGQRQEFDVVQFESIHLMAYLPHVRERAKTPLAVLDWHNIESDLMQQYSEGEGNPLRKMYARRTAKLMREAESRAARAFDAHIVVSDADAGRLRLLNPNARILVVENGVNVEHFTAEGESAESDSQRNRIVFVASMDYHANIDAAVSFARDLWPQVHQRNSNLGFTIVGRDPVPAVRELQSIPGVEVTGTVDDVRPYYREAMAAIAPLRVGGGSRLKILEAMAAGVPVVATTLGAEGLDVRHGENILIADSDKAMSNAILSLAQKSELRVKLIESGLELVKSRYDWRQLGAKLFASYQSLLSERRSE